MKPALAPMVKKVMIFTEVTKHQNNLNLKLLEDENCFFLRGSTYIPTKRGVPIKQIKTFRDCIYFPLLSSLTLLEWALSTDTVGKLYFFK